MECDDIVEEGEGDDTVGQHCPSRKVYNSRLSRKLNEKVRRDRLNSLIAQLAEEVPTIKYAHRRLDKSSVLRLTVSFLKLHQGLKHKNIARNNIFKDRVLFSKVNMMNDGVLMVITQSGLILYVSPAVKQMMGYQQSDVIGFDISRFVHPDDVSSFSQHCDDNDGVTKEAAFATFDKNDEMKQPHNVHIQSTQNHTFYARMLKLVSSVRKKAEEEDPYELMQVKTHRERREDVGPGEDLWVVANIKPFVQESIKEMSISISEFQKNNEWASMHDLDSKILAMEHRASLFHGFMPSEMLGKTPYFLISDDDLEYVCRSHQLIITEEEIPSTVFRMKTLLGSPLYVQSRSIIIKDKWTKKPKCIVSVNEVLSNDLGHRMLEYQKQRVDELTKASELSKSPEQRDGSDRDSDHHSRHASGSIHTHVSDSDSDNSLLGSDVRIEPSSPRQVLTRKAEALEIHKCTGKTLGEIFEEEALRYIDSFKNCRHSISSPQSSVESSYPVKRSFDSLDIEDTDSNSQDASSCGEPSSGSVVQSPDHLFALDHVLPSKTLPGKKQEERRSSSNSRPILKGILEGRLTFEGQNKYTVTDRLPDFGSAESKDSSVSVAGSYCSSVTDCDDSLAAMSPTSLEYQSVGPDSDIEAAESKGPVQSPTIGSMSLLEDVPLDQSGIRAHFAKQLLMKYGQIKDTFSSHLLTVSALRQHLENNGTAMVMNPEQQEIYQQLMGRLKQAENQLKIQNELIAEVDEELG